MNITLEDARELIRKQMKDQGCLGHSLESIELMQPHLYEWIKFFDIEQEIRNSEDKRNGN